MKQSYKFLQSLPQQGVINIALRCVAAWHAHDSNPNKETDVYFIGGQKVTLVKRNCEFDDLMHRFLAEKS